MTETTVPEVLVEAAKEAVGDSEWIEADAGIRAALAAVLPLHERQVRERIAAELRAVIFHCPTHDIPGSAEFDHRCIGCQRYAALSGAASFVAGHDSPNAQAVRDRREVGAGRKAGPFVGGGDD
jgi:hypothetical protein